MNRGLLMSLKNMFSSPQDGSEQLAQQMSRGADASAMEQLRNLFMALKSGGGTPRSEMPPFPMDINTGQMMQYPQMTPTQLMLQSLKRR